MVQKLEFLSETASQTAGPYVHIGCLPSHAGIKTIYPEDLGRRAVEDGVKGDRITIRGNITDGTGLLIRDGMIESWQPDAAGRFPGDALADAKVNGFCRFATDPDSGEFKLSTVKPGPVAASGGGKQAPHIALWIVARGINTGLQTRIYFDDEDNSADPLLKTVESRERLKTLIASKTGPGEYRFDICLQGVGETVFLDM